VKPRSKTRVICRLVEGPFLTDPEPLLQRALSLGIISVYDDGRGELCWFDGAPGEALRALHRLILRCKSERGVKWQGKSR
jgi:hypothetical protein